jgi:hypothetical protein
MHARSYRRYAQPQACPSRPNGRSSFATTTNSTSADSRTSTDKRASAAFAPEPNMQLYGRGIRRRLAPMLAEPKRIELAYSLLFSLPGTPVIRYGEEIGMGEDLKLKERYAIRTPMQWSGERNGGFSTAERTIFPVLKDGPLRL